jgi:glycolate oxidase FAD binding subunit
MNLLHPSTEEDVAHIICKASDSDKRVRIVGGGSRQGFGQPFQASYTLTTRQLQGVKRYEPGALTLIAGAGSSLREIEEVLSEEKQQLTFEPIDLRALLGNSDAEPTLGGVVASGAAGPRRIQAGGARDSLIGVRFVNGRGECASAGGRVMKNVTGYDLCKLMAGAHGSLGVLTELAFKVGPKPEAVACVLIHGGGDTAAVQAMSAALCSPYGVSGAAHLPAMLTRDGDRAVTMIRVEGFAQSVAYRARKLQAVLRKFGDVQIIDDQAAVAKGWRDVRDVLPFADREAAVWRISVKPSDGPKVVARIAQDLDVAAYYDWGGGLVWLATPDIPFMNAGAGVIRKATASVGGRATLVRAQEDTRRNMAVFPPEDAIRARLSESIRRAFDPNGLFSHPAA